MSSSGTPDPTPSPGNAPPGEAPYGVGANVRLAQRPRYLKSADPMPMLRPPDLIGEEETGVVVEVRSFEQRAVRFRRGTFLLATGQLCNAEADGASGPGS